MPGYYTYLMSSLPMLHFGEKPPLSFEGLLRMCEGIVSAEDIDVVKASTRAVDYDYGSNQPTFQPKAGPPSAGKKWRAFDMTLRNELVRARATSKKVDPLKYMRGEGYTDPFIAHIAIHAHRNPSILEAERILDQEKWRFLDELGTGHYFDIDSLIVYANKLLILERWERIKTADKTGILQRLTWKNEQGI